MQTGGGGGVAAQKPLPAAHRWLQGGAGAQCMGSGRGTPTQGPPEAICPQAATRILSKLASELCWVTGDVLAGRMLKENPSCFEGLQAKFSISRSGVRRPARRQQIQNS